MGKYVLRRLELLVPTVFGISVLVFALMRFLPGDVVQLMIDKEVLRNTSPEARATLYRMFGLDAPLQVGRQEGKVLSPSARFAQ